jgi:hypothetical protein
MFYMSKYIFKGLLFLTFLNLHGQDVKKDSTIFVDRYGLRMGTDIYKLTRNLYDKDYKGFEFNADYRFSKKIYLAAEAGFENKRTLDERLDYNTLGTFLKFGANYNFYDNWLDMDNQIFIGGRYGFSLFDQQLNAFRIYQQNPVNGENPFISSNEIFSGLTAHWIEMVLGFQAELLPNIYGGLNVRLNFMITQSRPENFDNLFINGFGRVYEGSNFGTTFNYTLSYYLPLVKKPKKNNTTN